MHARVEELYQDQSISICRLRILSFTPECNLNQHSHLILGIIINSIHSWNILKWTISLLSSFDDAGLPKECDYEGHCNNPF